MVSQAKWVLQGAPSRIFGPCSTVRAGRLETLREPSWATVAPSEAAVVLSKTIWEPLAQHYLAYLAPLLPRYVASMSAVADMRGSATGLDLEWHVAPRGPC